MNSSSKLIIITGASGGIGISLARMFLKSHCKVIGIDLQQNDLIADDNYLHFNCDVKKFDELARIIQSVDLCDDNILINCVGIREICPISHLSTDLFEEVMSVNVTSMFVSSKTFSERVRHLSPINGSIINIASVSGLMGEPDRTAYVTSKHAVIGLTKQLAIEYGKFGIRVNAVAPGVIRTPLTEQYYDDSNQVDKIKSGQVIDYLATPDDIVPLVNFLASDSAKFITGSTIVADGGWTTGKLI